MSKFEDYKEIIDRLIRLQQNFYPEVQEYYKMGEGNVSLLRLRGVDGGTLLLKCENNRIKYAQGNETPIHTFTCTPDTFLNIWLGTQTLRHAITENHFMIESVKTGTIDLVEAQKWARAFEKSRGLIKRFIGL